MTFFQRARLWWSARASATGEYNDGGTTIVPANWLVSGLGGALTGSGVRITERTAEGLPAIYACVHVISETVGQLPLKLYRRTASGKGKEPDVEHPLYKLLHDRANPEHTAIQFREMVTRWLAIWGRAYVQIERNARGEAVALWPLHPARMFVQRDTLNRKVFRYWMAPADYREFVHNPAQPEIMHLHINCDDGIDGRSPLVVNRESLGITLAAEQYVGSYFANGAVPGMVLTHPNRLTPRAKENIRTSWLEKFMGSSRANKLAILEEGIALNVVGVDPEKSQLAALRTAQVEAAARIYRVPLFLIQSQTKDTSWGSGIQEQMLGFVNTTLMPWFVQWTQAISRDLLSRQAVNSHEAIFVVNSLLKGDITKRYEAYASARQNGWMNGDEIRELEDMNPIVGGAGKVYWMGPGSQPIIGDGTTALVEPEPPPKPTPPADEPEGVM